MSIYECTMVDSEREPTPYVRYPNIEMVDTKRKPNPDVRCTNVEQHTMDADFSPLDIHPSYDQREESADLVDGPRDVVVVKRRPTQLRDTLQEVEKHATPSGSFKERRRPHIFSSYIALMSHIIDYEPSSYEEAANQQVGRDAMMEEYQLIMKKDVWDIVLRPEGKFVATPKWIQKIKNVVDGSIKKYPAMHTNTIGQHTKGQNTRTHEMSRNNLTLHQFNGVSIMVLRMNWMELYIY